MPYTVNCSIMFTELPLLDRPRAAKAAGFGAVEFWWPFDVAVPPEKDVESFIRAVDDAGVQLSGLNFFAGDMPGGDRGLLSWPERSGEFVDNIDVTLRIGQRLGCRAFNALYGNRVDGADAQEQDELATQNLVRATKATAGVGGTVLIEPVSGSERYPLLTAADALSAIDRAQAAGAGDNMALLADLYHLQTNGDDVEVVIAEHVSRIGHVQIADAPGRGEPGSGDLPLPDYVQALQDGGYRGWVGLEYKPTTDSTADSFGWHSS
ncbi:MAG: TIM barrel protein [Ornithinimicrobium sp.]